MLLKMLVVQFVFQAFFITICAIMIASLIADLMDEQELETDRRQEGMFSSAISFSVKATASGGLILGGLLLDFVIAFPTQAEVGAIDQDTLFRLAIIDGVAVPLLFFIPIYLMSRITMTRERLAEVQSALEARHASTTGSEVSAG
jgi:Na+/melibiose symporter-like transporter